MERQGKKVEGGRKSVTFTFHPSSLSTKKSTKISVKILFFPKTGREEEEEETG